MEAKLVNNLFAEKEDIVICPYNSVHTVPASRLQYHLSLCRQDKNNDITPEMQELLTCPFNAKHKFFAAEKAFHYRICADRPGLERHIVDKGAEGGQISVPAVAGLHFQATGEDWENDGRPGARAADDISWNPDESSALAKGGDGDRSVRRPTSESNAMRLAKGMKQRTTLPRSMRAPAKGRPDTRGLHPIDAAKLWADVPVSVLSEELQGTIAHVITALEDIEDMEDEILSQMACSGVGRGQGPPPNSIPAPGSAAPVGRPDPPLDVPAHPGMARQTPVAPPQQTAAPLQQTAAPLQQTAARSVTPGSIALKKVASAKTFHQPASQPTPPVQPIPSQPTPPVQPIPSQPRPPVQPASQPTPLVQPIPSQPRPPVQPASQPRPPVQPIPSQPTPPVQPIPSQPAPSFHPTPQLTPGQQTPGQIPQCRPPAEGSGLANDSLATPPPRAVDSGQPAAVVRPMPASASEAQPRRPRPLGRAAPQKPLGASVSQPGIPPSQPRVQTPPPKVQENSSEQQEGISEPQQGFHKSQQGFFESQQRFPEHQQGFSERQQGFSEHQQGFHQQGFPEHEEGFADPQQGFAEHQQGFAEHQQGFLEQQQGFADPQQGVQPGVHGMPLPQQGAFWPWMSALPGGRVTNVRPPPGFGRLAQGAQHAIPATSPTSSYSPTPTSPVFSPTPSSAFSPAPSSSFSPASNSAFSSTSASTYGSVPSSAYNPALRPTFGPVPTPTQTYTSASMSSYGEDLTPVYGHAPNPAFQQAPNPAFHQAPSHAFHQAPSPAFGQAPSPGFDAPGQSPAFGHAYRQGRPRAPGSFPPTNAAYGSYNSGPRQAFGPAVINRAPGARGPALLPHHSSSPFSPHMQSMQGAGRGAPGFAPRPEMGGMGRGLSYPGQSGPSGLMNSYSPWQNQFPPGGDQGGQ